MRLNVYVVNKKAEARINGRKKSNNTALPSLRTADVFLVVGFSRRVKLVIGAEKSECSRRLGSAMSA